MNAQATKRGAPEPGAVPARSRIRGVSLLLAGWVLWATGVAVTLGAFYYIGWGGLLSGRPPAWEFFLVFFSMVAGATVAHFGQVARLTGRRHLTGPATFPGRGELFVLYLRSFREDAGRGKLERGWLRPESLLPLNVGPLFFSGRSMEEHLIASFRPLAPVIAVGSPRDRLPPVGARRLYLPRDDWQQPVRELMSRARLVVIAVDATPGTVWEFVEATRTVPPQRLVLAVPADREKYADFRAAAESALTERAARVLKETGTRWSPPALPEYRGLPDSQTPLKKDVISALVSYRAGWSPAFSRLPRLSPPYDIGHVAIRRALRPTLERLAAYEENIPEARDPSVREARVIADKIGSLRRAYVLFMTGAVFVGLVRMSPADHWGLPQDGGGWWLLAVSAAAALGLLWGVWLLEKKARLRAVPRPGAQAG
ncbi:hypothetical protein [Amycolatopsis sp. cmx-4-68]|uniref:hypothetical protein n=1 Tax=Amycolatopsis sp. cmx-4-68 TaxID=2790938 RepID=UPI0039799E51